MKTGDMENIEQIEAAIDAIVEVQDGMSDLMWRIGMQLDLEYRQAHRALIEATNIEWGGAKWRKLREERAQAGMTLRAFYEKFPDLRPAYGYDRDTAPDGIEPPQISEPLPLELVSRGDAPE